MKQIYTLIAILFIALSAVQAKTPITFTSSFGDWSTASNRDLNRVPANGDSIVIPEGFFVARNNNNVILNWSTARELNNNNFEVQRSLNGNNWSTIAIMMGAGTANNVQQYSFADKKMTAAVAYYRIKQVDIDGNYEYSTIKSIHDNEAAPATRIYANGSTVNIEFNKEVKIPFTIRIINMNGQVVSQRDLQQASYRITMNMNNNINGMYIVQLNDNAGWKEVKKIVL
jgi:hypothetical protein